MKPGQTSSYLKKCPQCGALAYGMSTSKGAWIECSQCGFKTDLKSSYCKACNAWNDMTRKMSGEEVPPCDSGSDGEPQT